MCPNLYSLPKILRPNLICKSSRSFSHFHMLQGVPLFFMYVSVYHFMQYFGLIRDTNIFSCLGLVFSLVYLITTYQIYHKIYLNESSSGDPTQTLKRQLFYLNQLQSKQRADTQKKNQWINGDWPPDTELTAGICSVVSTQHLPFSCVLPLILMLSLLRLMGP